MSVVPFHAWSPDTYQGAPTPFVAFLSVAPKVASALVLYRLLDAVVSGGAAEAIEKWSVVIAALAVLSMLVGNLLALAQRDIKRMLAYSGIAHMGYLLLALVVDGPRLAHAGDRLPARLCADECGRVHGGGHALRPAGRAAPDLRPVGLGLSLSAALRLPGDLHAVAGRHPADRGLHRQVPRLPERGGRRPRRPRRAGRAGEPDRCLLLPAGRVCASTCRRKSDSRKVCCSTSGAGRGGAGRPGHPGARHLALGIWCSGFSKQPRGDGDRRRRSLRSPSTGSPSTCAASAICRSWGSSASPRRSWRSATTSPPPRSARTSRSSASSASAASATRSTSWPTT